MNSRCLAIAELISKHRFIIISNKVVKSSALFRKTDEKLQVHSKLYFLPLEKSAIALGTTFGKKFCSVASITASVSSPRRLKIVSRCPAARTFQSCSCFKTLILSLTLYWHVYVNLLGMYWNPNNSWSRGGRSQIILKSWLSSWKVHLTSKHQLIIDKSYFIILFIL